jgi:hypothetical protein
MPLPIHVENLEEQGITITSTADPAFDADIRALFQGDSEELLKLKPFLVIISNGSARTMVAYTLTWVLRLPRGSQTGYSPARYPDAVADAFPYRGNEIRPGEQKIVPMGIELDCGRWTGKPTESFYLDQFIDWFKAFAEVTEVQVGFDAVIFDNGELIGPNKAHLDESFLTYLHANENWYRSVLEALDAGKSVDEAFLPIQAVLAADPQLDIDDPERFWRRQSTAGVRRLRLRYGDHALQDILRKAIRKEPFKIYRRE